MCIHLWLLYASVAKYCVLGFLGYDQKKQACEYCICTRNNPDRYALRLNFSAKLNLGKNSISRGEKKTQNWSHSGTYPLFLSVKEIPTEQPHWLKIRRILTGFAVVGSSYHMHCLCSCFFSIRRFLFFSSSSLYSSLTPYWSQNHFTYVMPQQKSVLLWKWIWYHKFSSATSLWGSSMKERLAENKQAFNLSHNYQVWQDELWRTNEGWIF